MLGVESPGEGNGNPLQYSCVENPHGQRSLAGYCHGVARIRHDLVTKPPHVGCKYIFTNVISFCGIDSYYYMLPIFIFY